MAMSKEKQQWLASSAVQSTLPSMARGIERETLRVTPKGRIAQTPHPTALGSTLCHGSITTDYSEALLELITEPHQSIEHCLEELQQLHSFVQTNLDNELLWPFSMPPLIANDKDIPIAEYGDSLVGSMKHAYRRGLEVRYGRKMQSIAGLHYNLSYPDSFWQEYQKAYCPHSTMEECKNKAYFGLVRSFLNNGWILTLLTGSSPACHTSFVDHEDIEALQLKQVKDYLLAPQGCSLRMGGIGYHNAKQSDLFICYDSLEQYVHTLSQALQLPCQEYADIGLYDQKGERHQLSTHMLQIENEFYGSIRPKQVAQSLERPTLALERRGVAYVEIRNIDIDPLAPSGIHKSTAAMVEIFVTGCLLDHAGFLDRSATKENPIKNEQIAMFGRDHSQPFIQTALEHWQSLESIATTLDEANQSTLYSNAYQLGLKRLQNPSQLPSSLFLKQLQSLDTTEATPLTAYGLSLGKEHQQIFRKAPMAAEVLEKLEQNAQASNEVFAKLPAASDQELTIQLQEYFKNLPHTNRTDCTALQE